MLNDILRGLIAYLGDSFVGRHETANEIYQILTVIQGGSPKRSHVPIQIYHEGSAYIALHDRGKRNNSATGKWLNENRMRRCIPEPLSNMGNKPRFPAWIPERATLWHARNVHGGDH